MAKLLEYDYPVIGKSFIDLDNTDLDEIEKLYGKTIRDLYKKNIDHMKFKLRKVKITKFLNKLTD